MVLCAHRALPVTNCRLLLSFLAKVVYRIYISGGYAYTNIAKHIFLRNVCQPEGMNLKKQSFTYGRAVRYKAQIHMTNSLWNKQTEKTLTHPAIKTIWCIKKCSIGMSKSQETQRSQAMSAKLRERFHETASKSLQTKTTDSAEAPMSKASADSLLAKLLFPISLLKSALCFSGAGRVPNTFSKHVRASHEALDTSRIPSPLAQK